MSYDDAEVPFGTGEMCPVCGSEIELGAPGPGRMTASCDCCSGAVLE